MGSLSAFSSISTSLEVRSKASKTGRKGIIGVSGVMRRSAIRNDGLFFLNTIAAIVASVVSAVVRDRAGRAVRAARKADLSPMEYEPVVDAIPILSRDAAHKRLLHLEYVIGCLWDQPDASGDAINVGVDTNPWLSDDDGEVDIGCLPPNPLETHQLPQRLGHFPAIVLHDRLCRLLEVACLAIGVGDAPDVA